MTQPNAQTEKPKDKRRYDPELLKKGLYRDLVQYELLSQCLRGGEEGIKRWSKWRQEHLNEEIFLEGANFSHSKMKKVNLMRYEKLVSLKNAQFINAHLEGSYFMGSNLDGADFEDASLQGALLSGSSIKGANFTLAIVDGQTVIWKPRVNHYSKKTKFTDFTGVSIDTLRIDPGTKQLLEYNIRRKNWEDWYIYKDWYKLEPKRERNKYSQFLIKNIIGRFWEISDYGMSTKVIIKTFVKWALVFAVVYYVWGAVDYYFNCVKDYPGIVSNLFVLEDSQQAVSPWLVPFRAIYFSIVTMTTLGFGDMYANAHGFVRGFFGHLLLALQVILGYVLLGALVTRFAVLFTAGGPAGKFVDDKGQKTEDRSQKMDN